MSKRKSNKKLAIITLFASSILTGCMPTKMEAARAEYICKDSGGVYSYGNALLKVTCNDGSRHDYNNDIVLPKGFRVGEND